MSDDRTGGFSLSPKAGAAPADTGGFKLTAPAAKPPTETPAETPIEALLHPFRGPSALQQAADIDRKIRDLYEASPEKKAGVPFYEFALKNPQARDLHLSSPLAMAMSPGEGLAGAKMPIGKAPVTAPPVPISPAQRAMDIGYTLPPKMVEGQSAVTKVLEGWGGKIKTEQQASAKNQIVTNKLAAKSLGLPEDTLLTEEVFRRVRSDAWDQYKAVAQVLPQTTPDQAFWTTVSNIGKARGEAAAAFPETLRRPEIEKFRDQIQSDFSRSPNFSTDAAMEWVRQMRHDGGLNIASKDPGTRALGYAQRQAAEAVDDLIERNVLQSVYSGGGVEAAVDPAVVANYRAARQKIAISHDLETATNTTTGDVSAHAVSALLSKGRPLTGDLRTVAEVASAFPRATRFSPSYGGVEPWSALDMVGAGVSFAKGSPEAALTFLGRPLARGAVLSRPYQRGFVQPQPPPTPPKAPGTPLLRPGVVGSVAEQAGGGIRPDIATAVSPSVIDLLPGQRQ